MKKKTPFRSGSDIRDDGGVKRKEEMKGREETCVVEVKVKIALVEGQ